MTTDNKKPDPDLLADLVRIRTGDSVTKSLPTAIGAEDFCEGPALDSVPFVMASLPAPGRRGGSGTGGGESGGGGNSGGGTKQGG